MLCCAMLCCAVSSLSYRLRVVLQCHPCVSCKSLVSVLCAGMNCKLLSLGLPIMHHVPECCSPGPNLHLLLYLQILVVGKISQAAILAAAAYRNHETFKRQTGITKSRLIYDREHHDTKVGHMSRNWSPSLLQQQPVWLALFTTLLLSSGVLCPLLVYSCM